MSSLDQLNPMQKEAVACTEGPLLILAGAGSGKTRVLTHRIAYLIEEKKVNPWNILAITFTNKAAGEMRERVDRQVSFGAESIWVSTFHAACARILRRHIEFLGYTTHFTIYDTDDQKSLLKQVYKALDIDNRLYKERMVLGRISSAKDKLITPDEYIRDAGADYHERRIGEIYAEYQTRLKKNDALDFDDLLMKTVELFRTQPVVLDYYQERFKYILIDEYQDTNKAQFELVRLLADKYKNICVVGDDDQSIYKFRGADIGNILNFEEAFPGAAVVKLEQNYRSTQTILDAANAVIRNNVGRKEKSLWTANGTGEKIIYKLFDQAYEEANYIIRDILNRGYAYEDCAVLYRTNAQSRLLEEKCIACSVPYRLVGGVNFYQRKEIKDVLAYLKTIANGRDDVAAARIINVPKRGIGASSLGKVTVFAAANDYTLYDAMTRARGIPGLGKAAEKIGRFTDLIESFRARVRGMNLGPADTRDVRDSGEPDEIGGGAGIGDGAGIGMLGAGEADGPHDRTYSIRQLIEDILDETGYREELAEEGTEEADSRLENIEELVNKAVDYEREADNPTLDGFLEEVALVADVDSLDAGERRVTLMTLHSAKGLEFENVYLSGMEDGVFPSYMTVTSDDPAELEEERRLCYVGITRAKKHLTLTGARMRMVNGQTRYSKQSCFLDEIPEELIEDGSEVRSGFGGYGSGSIEGRDGYGNRYDGGRGSEEDRLFSSVSDDGGYSRKAALGRERGGDDFGAEPVRWLDDIPAQQGLPWNDSPRSERSQNRDFRTGGLSPRTARRDKPVGTSRFAPDPKPDFGKTFAVQKSKTCIYRVGDRVNHVKFGEGTVTAIEERPKDYMVAVDFDSVGVRRLFASFLKSQES